MTSDQTELIVGPPDTAFVAGIQFAIRMRGCSPFPLTHSSTPEPAELPKVEGQLACSAKPGWTACGRSGDNAGALAGEGTALTFALRCQVREGFDMRQNLWLGKGLAPLSAASQSYLFCNINKTSKSIFCHTCSNFSSKPSSRCSLWDCGISKASSELFICRGISRYNWNKK